MPDENFGYGVNVGGGITNAISILELFQVLEEILQVKIDYTFGEERPSDQKVFISDNSLIQRLTGWHPTTTYQAGLKLLISELV
jgi:CDP-paratose 2-epimerase